MLTTFSLMLGVGLVVVVLSAYGIITEAFQRNAQSGFNLVVGPGKGSALQLTLNSVYYLSQPNENIDYTKFMEFYFQEERAEMVRKYGGDPALGERDGVYAGYVGEGGFAIPLALGDYLGQFRVVGTTPEFFKELRVGSDLDETFRFAEGRALLEHSDEHSYFESVLGSRVAKEEGLKVGDSFNPSHSVPGGEGHGQAFTVVGVMEPTGTPNDRAAFVNLEGFYLLDKHSLPLTGEEIMEPPTEAFEDALGHMPLTIPQREVTSVLIKNEIPFYAASMYDTIKESDNELQAAAPVGEIAKLMGAIVGPLLKALLVITLITCMVQCDEKMIPLFTSAAGITTLLPYEAASPAVDYHASFIDAVDVWYTTHGVMPYAIDANDPGYLTVSDPLIDYWKNWLDTHVPSNAKSQLSSALTRGTSGRSLRVGINWQGNREHHADIYRSLPLAELEPLSKLPHVQLINLQFGDGVEQLEHVSFADQIHRLPDDVDTTDGAFTDTAAILQNLDAVVTSDTALAHLAGSVGTATRVLLGRVPDWRWLIEGDRTPWYPTMQLHRQKEIGDWSSVIQSCCQSLQS